MKKLNSMEIASLTVMFIAIASFTIISAIRNHSDRRAIAIATAKADSIDSCINSAPKDTITIEKKRKSKKFKAIRPKREPKGRDYRDENVND